jgi:hypothetical protein
MGETVIELLDRFGYGYDAPFTWIAAGCVGVAVLFVVWLVIPERWRRFGRPRSACPQCHYDLRGVLEASAFPVTCAECGLEIDAERLRQKPRPVRRTVAIAALLLLAAHVTALFPRAKRVGPKRLIPSTILVLQPMDVGQWTDDQLHGGRVVAGGAVRGTEVGRRLISGELWRWQEWLLYQRVARACRRRDDYGLTPAQYDTVVRLRTTRIEARGREPLSDRLTHLAWAAGVTIGADWEELAAAGVVGLFQDGHVSPEGPGLPVVRALDSALDPKGWNDFMWDVLLDGAVAILPKGDPTTGRCRIYDVTDLIAEPDDTYALDFLISDLVEPDHRTRQGAYTSFVMTGRLVILAPSRVHVQIEDLLDGLRDAIAAGPPPSRPYVPPANPRQLEGTWSLLDDLRYLRTVPIEAVRDAGPLFDDGVTEDELDACGRDSFGLLDRIRHPVEPQRAGAGGS